MFWHGRFTIQQNKILKFHDLIKHCELSFMYKYVYSILPKSFKSYNCDNK